MGNIASDHLFVLIQSMTKSEKRYFKLQPMQEDSNHKILFDLLENQREYNEEKLLIALKGTGIELALSLAKNRLYHFLLKTLASFHTKSDAHAEVQRHIQGISVLLKRELADQAHKLLNSVYKICEKNEILHLLPELFRLEENCINQLPIQQHERLELLKDLEIRRGNALAKLIEINQFGKLKTDLLLIHYSEGQIRTPEHMNTLVSITTELEQSESNSTESLLKKLQIQ
ncbi:MAG: hypothetical protein ACKO8Q_04705, partial [Bacteroidota bacterium]